MSHTPHPDTCILIRCAGHTNSGLMFASLLTMMVVAVLHATFYQTQNSETG